MNFKEQLLAEQHSHCFRDVNYLRISITDRCNQRCTYCMPHGDIRLFKHTEILSYEEILTVVAASVKCGFRKFRITGGEPLVRKGICNLIDKMTHLAGVDEVVLTTNGVLLEEMAAALYAAGIRRLNVSLDTLNPLKFRKITKRDHFRQVLRGIEKARRVGLTPVKVNVVVIRGVNHDEVADFANWAIREALTVRFIEFMPIGSHNQWDARQVVSIDEIRQCLEKVTVLQPIERGKLDGPVSHHFCHSCNRLRLTPEGKLRPCLLRDEEFDVKIPLRGGCGEAALIGLIQKAVGAKMGHCDPALSSGQRAQRGMSRIGG